MIKKAIIFNILLLATTSYIVSSDQQPQSSYYIDEELAEVTKNAFSKYCDIPLIFKINNNNEIQFAIHKNTYTQRLNTALTNEEPKVLQEITMSVMLVYTLVNENEAVQCPIFDREYIIELPNNIEYLLDDMNVHEYTKKMIAIVMRRFVREHLEELKKNQENAESPLEAENVPQA